MITQVLHCPYCDETDIVRHGMSPEGKQRYRCRQCLEGRGRTFLLEYAYAGQSPAVKQQIVDALIGFRGLMLQALSEKHNSFLRLLKKKGFKEERVTTTELYDIGKSHDPGIQQEP